MIPRPLVIVGAGGSGREVLALLRDIQRHTPGSWDFKGFLATESPESAMLRRIDAPFLGNPAEFKPAGPTRGCAFVVGIGDPTARRMNYDLMVTADVEPATLIHPSTWVGADVEIGPGSIICATSVITTNVRIGRGSQINIGCVIAHDNRLGDYVTLAQSVNLAGNVRVHDDSTLYTRATVIPGVTIGAGAIVGAGAVVIDDVAPYSTVVGVPATVRG